MKEQEIIFLAVSALDEILPSAYTIRTQGGDSPASPPLCLLNWDSTRISNNGANPFAEIVRDATGRATGREFHRYNLMELDITIRTYEESDRDTLLSDVADAFLPYEYDSNGFHEDTTEWEVGDPSPRSNPVVEPDWYEGGLELRFVYVSRVQQDAETLTSTEKSIDGSGV